VQSGDIVSIDPDEDIGFLDIATPGDVVEPTE
jgi:hypothetical protein